MEEKRWGKSINTLTKNQAASLTINSPFEHGERREKGAKEDILAREEGFEAHYNQSAL